MSLYRINIISNKNSSSYFSCTLCHDYYKIPLCKGCILDLSKYHNIRNKHIIIKVSDEITTDIFTNCFRLLPVGYYPVIDDLLYKLLV